MKPILLCVALLASALVARAAAAVNSTNTVPNLRVLTNATTAQLNVTTTNWSLPMPSTGLLGGTAGAGVAPVANSLISGFVADPLARYAFSPIYSLSNTFTWGGSYGSPNVNSSTYSSWGEGIGTNLNSFNLISFQVYPFDAAAVPTTVITRLRYVGATWAAGAGTLSGITNPSSWTILVASTNTVSLTPLRNNQITVSLPSTINTGSNLWFEVIANGKIGVPQALITTPSASVPPPAYQVGSTLTSTNWAATSAIINHEFTVELGAVSALSGFSPTPALFSALNLTNAAVLSIPTTNFAVSGTEFNLYWRNVIRSSSPLEDLQLDVTCTKGTQFTSMFRVTPVDADAGAYSLALSVSDITNSLTSFSGQLKIAANSAGSGNTRKLLVIGDSTTAGGQVVTELNRISGTNGFKLDTIGTQGTGTNKHEGHSGWSIATFYSGNTSPFTNGAGAFSFNYYLTNNSLSMASNDWIFVNLGINDVFSQTTDSGASSVAASFLTTFSNMVVNFRATVPGVRCGLCVTIPPSYSQDAFGNDYGNGQTFFRYARNRSILAEALVAYSQTGVYIIPIAGGLDTLNNMVTTTTVLNSRNTNSWTYLSNSVHPATIGYYQIADQMWAALKCLEP